ncbi:MAG: SRPBCC family protein [Pirellulaceae bacterium]
MPKFEVNKSVVIHSDPNTVYERVADYRTWTQWSPWLIAEPDASVIVSENPNSVGSNYAWAGEVVGAGELEHESLVPGKAIRDEIRFLSPMKSVSKVGFDFAPVSDGTRVTWSMSGSLPFFLFFLKNQIEIFVGMDYERGLKMLKEWIETGSIKSQTAIHGTQPMGPFNVVGIRSSSRLSEIGPAMDKAFGAAKEELEKAGISTDCETISVYHKMTPKTQTLDFTSGFLYPTLPAGVPTHLSH